MASLLVSLFCSKIFILFQVKKSPQGKRYPIFYSKYSKRDLQEFKNA